MCYVVFIIIVPFQKNKLFKVQVSTTTKNTEPFPIDVKTERKR